MKDHFYIIQKRTFDIILSVFLLPFLILPLVILAIIVRLSSPGPILYWSDRVGKNNTIFKMPKFRSMRKEAPEIATHLLDDPSAFLTTAGKMLRRTSLDELPQIFNILRGDLSFVGPRPALHNQFDLVALRSACGVQQLIPGLTGWAQINGRDSLPMAVKVAYDEEYLRMRSFRFDLKILALTLLKVLYGDNVSH